MGGLRHCFTMGVKQCHKPIMTGNGLYLYGEEIVGLFYDCVLPTLDHNSDTVMTTIVKVIIG